MKEGPYDFGAAFDGDGDRNMVSMKLSERQNYEKQLISIRDYYNVNIVFMYSYRSWARRPSLLLPPIL